ncbi:MAG: hypothetical protein M9944_03550 [Rhizobiaceae bacterium]|nr:hypothetical protein [Rhizobiaceae bacterium]
MKSTITWVRATIISMLLISLLSPARAGDLEGLMQRYNDLFAKGRYDEAYSLIEGISDSNDPILYMERGLMLGRGLLSTGVDKCGAILELERAFALGMSNLIETMDFLYGGDWAAISAIEGNPEALYVIGNRILNSSNSRNMLYIFDKYRPYFDSYPYFVASFAQGNERAKERVDTIKEILDRVYEDRFDASIEFRKILCDVRRSGNVK